MDKQRVRDRVWDAMEAAGVARFPFPPHDSILNFERADGGAEFQVRAVLWPSIPPGSPTPTPRRSSPRPAGIDWATLDGTSLDAIQIVSRFGPG